jgi:hypothetical protein
VVGQLNGLIGTKAPRSRPIFGTPSGRGIIRSASSISSRMSQMSPALMRANRRGKLKLECGTRICRKALSWVHPIIAPRENSCGSRIDGARFGLGKLYKLGWRQNYPSCDNVMPRAHRGGESRSWSRFSTCTSIGVRCEPDGGRLVAMASRRRACSSSTLPLICKLLPGQEQHLRACRSPAL